MKPLDMTVKAFREQSQEAIENMEKKAIALVEKYSDIYPNHDVLFMGENLMLIWILLTQNC